MKALVTGASGFIGKHLIERLSGRLEEVRALVRGSSRVSHLQAHGASLVLGDVTDRERLGVAVRGVDVVYHLAGCTTARSQREFMRINARGTAHVAAACAAQTTPPTMVLVSSLAAAGPARHDRPLVEEDRLSPVSHYGHSKLAAERAAARWSARIPLSIVRPPVVFGPWDRSMLPLFQMVARLGVIVSPGFMRPRMSWLHVTDLAEALVLVAERGRRVGSTGDCSGDVAGRYFVADEEHPSIAEFGQAISRSLGRRSVLVLHSPHLTLWAAAGAVELFNRLRRHAGGSWLDKAREATAGSWTCDAGTLRRELGFSRACSLQQRVRETTEWYKQQGWL